MNESIEPEESQEDASLMKKLWFGLFILMYPIVITFSLLFTAVLWLFSSLSLVISKVIEWTSGSRPAAHNTEASSLIDEPKGTAPRE